MTTPESSAPAEPAADSAEAAPTNPAPFRLGNRPALTGIRALGMACVLVYHANFGAMTGAWAALQIFFVLSGFLITYLMASEARNRGRISLTGFYSRRAVRLLPPLFLAVALVAIYASLVHVWEAGQRVWGDSLAALFYYADYRSATGHAPFLGFFAQAWSLSVEEQFYIVWAVLLAVVVARGRRNLGYWMAGIGLALSAADRTWTVLSAPHVTGLVADRAYFSFDTRADALFFGCLLGLLAADGYLHRWPQWALRVLTGAAVVASGLLIWILFSVPVFSESALVWWQPVATVTTAVIIVYFVLCPMSLGTRFVGLGVFVFLGNLSYTVYLVHFGVYLALVPGPNGTHWSFWPTELLRLAIIMAIALASWFVIEKPLTQWRARAVASRVDDRPAPDSRSPPAAPLTGWARGQPQSRLGRMPQATWRESSALTTGRSAAWVTPINLASVVMTRTGSPWPEATMVATTSGSNTSAFGTAPPAATEANSASSSSPEASMAGPKTSQMSGWNPHRLTEAGREPSSCCRLEAVGGGQVFVRSVPGYPAPLGQADQVAVVVHRADATRDGVVSGHRGPQPVADQCVLRGAPGQMPGQQAHGHLTVDIVGVGHGEVLVGRQRTPGRQHGVDGSEGESLFGVRHVHVGGPALLDVVADGRAGLGVEDQYHLTEARGQGIADQQVDDRLAVRPDRCQGLAPSVAPGHACSQYHQGGAHAPGHPPQRSTALAHVMPPPNPVSRTWSPWWSRSVSKASTRARGMDADEVLP